MDDIKRMRELHFYKNHVFINGDFGYHKDNVDMILDNKNDRHYIHYDHRVHIFISYDYSSLNDGSLRWFVDFCKSRTKKKIIIHVAKSNKDLIKKIKRQLRYKKNWKMYVEKDHTKVGFEHHQGEWFIKDEEMYIEVFYIMICYNPETKSYYLISD